jgi:hypothetical protein
VSIGNIMPKEVADAINGAIRDCFMDCGGPDNVATGLKEIAQAIEGRTTDIDRLSEILVNIEDRKKPK